MPLRGDEIAHDCFSFCFDIESRSCEARCKARTGKKVNSSFESALARHPLHLSMRVDASQRARVVCNSSASETPSALQPTSSRLPPATRRTAILGPLCLPRPRYPSSPRFFRPFLLNVSRPGTGPACFPFQEPNPSYFHPSASTPPSGTIRGVMSFELGDQGAE